MKEEEFAELLALGYEAPGVEFKGPGTQDNRNLFGKVARAVLGMANLRGGGLVIIGVTEEDGVLDPVGLTADQLKSWSNFDKLSVAINECASPCVVFDLRTQMYKNKLFIVLEIKEFGDIPVLCCQDYADYGGKKQILRKGACYVRSRHKPETSEVPSEDEMRELLELAIDKGVRKFVDRASRAGFLLPTPPEAPRSPGESEAAENGKD